MKNYIINAIVFCSLIFTMGCEEYLNVNDNPNVATSSPIDGLLNRVTHQTPVNAYRVSNGYTSYFTQYLASPNQGSPTDTYDEVNYSTAWGNLYGVMTDAYDLINNAEEQGADLYAGVGKIIMAINLSYVADSWESAPYSEAFSGEIIQPGYDSGEQIYNTVLSLLDESISLLNSGGETRAITASKDLFYGGDVTRWIKLANGLKARYLNHFSKQGSYDPAAVLSALGSGLQGNEDDAELTTFDVRNPWADVAIDNDNLVLGGWLSEQFIDALNGTTFGVFDPRLPLITEPFEEDGETTFLGTPNGAGRRGDGTVQVECYLETSGFYSSEEAPLLVFTYSEQKFIEAEAAFRTDDKQRAMDAFVEGIKSNMTKVGVSTEDQNAFIADKYPGLSAGNLTLLDIMNEKYIALFLNPETWNDARRFDYQYTDFELPEGAQLPDYIRRLQFPDTEMSRNGSNVPEISGLTDPVYWDN